MVRHSVLARIVDHDDATLLCGAHPRSLTPVDAVQVVRQAWARLRRKRSVPADRLRGAAFRCKPIR